MINKTMTFFWSGEKLSWLRYMTLYSFRKLNPDWVMELHLSKPIHNLDKKWSTREVQDNFSSISKDSIDKIYDLDINIIEHIPQRYCQHLFTELYRCLKTGGVVRFTNPDFDLGYQAYKRKEIEFFNKYKGNDLDEKFLYFFASHHVVEKSESELEAIKKSLRTNFSSMSKEEFADHYTLQIPEESQERHTESHISWWNYEKMEYFLKTAGFKKIYLSKAQESKFPEMIGTGRNSGFDSTHPEFSMFVEAIK